VCVNMRLVSLDAVADSPSAPIHVNIIMNINIILLHCALTNSDEKRWGAYSTEKGKRELIVSLGKYFIIFLGKV
jgi:hypothetical protein